jgi:hypothetical protein
MYHHPETLMVMHKERQARLEVEAARYALIRALLRRRPILRRRKPDLTLPVRLRPLLR